MQNCRDCEKPLRRIYRRKEKIKKTGRWYWPTYLFCIGCKKSYFIESEKVLVRPSRKKASSSKRVERV